MRELRTLVLFALGVAAVGCGDGGSGGSATGGAGGVGGASGGGASCIGGGKGTLDVGFKIDMGVPGDVSFKGSSGLEQDFVSNAKVQLAADLYTVSARRVTTLGLVVGRAFYPKPHAPVCVAPNATSLVTVEYGLEPGSQKLWFAGGVDTVHTGAINAADLGASGDVAASVTLSDTVQNPRGIAFDREGNLWIGDAAGSLAMYARDSLGASRTDAPDVVLSGAALCPGPLPCGPRALAFDNAGGVWVALSDRLVHFPAAALAAAGEPLPDVTLTGPDVSAPEALALDASESLWVANSDAGVAKFEAAHLLADSAAPAEVVLMGSTPEPVVTDLATPVALAFDGDGALWVGYSASNVVARYEPDLLAATASVTPTVQLKIDVLALVEAMAFDDSGSLWIGGSGGRLARISVTQLMPGGDPNVDALSITSTDISYAVGLAFDPPAKLTPIAR